MPIYEYQCKACGAHHEAIQKMADAPLRKCPECGKSTQADLPENRKLLYESPLKNFRWP